MYGYETALSSDKVKAVTDSSGKAPSVKSVYVPTCGGNVEISERGAMVNFHNDHYFIERNDRSDDQLVSLAIREHEYYTRLLS